jgi:hypothetical protein
MCPKFKCNTVSVSFSACRCSSVVFSSKVGREKKRVWRQVCEWLFADVACLPAAVSLLLLMALFMQISGVSLTLTWPHRLCLLRVLCTMLLLQAFPFPSILREVTLHPLSQACVFIYSSRGKWVFPPLLWSFPPTAAFTSFPTPDCWACAAAPAGRVFVYSSRGRWALPPLLWSLPPSATLTSFPAPGCRVHAPLSCRSLSGQAQLVYLQLREGFPSPPLWSSGCPILFAMCVCCSYCLLLSFSFFPRCGSVCPGGYAVLAQGCLWEYHGTAKLTLSASSQAVWSHVTGSGPGSLLVSPFNVKWRFSVQAGGVEGLDFCLFLVALPARCVSSISPRFHFRRHAFCFLPLATILESSCLLSFYQSC